MACLRSFSRRNLSPKWFCKTPSPLVLHHIKDYAESSLPDSSLLIRRFHRRVFFEDRTKMYFAQPMGSGVSLCRHMSSSSSSSSCKPEESCIKTDAFGNVVEELVPEKSLEAMATKVSVIDECTAAIENLSFPEDCVQQVINGIHELTGFNWWMSIVLTAFLVNGLMSPVSLRIQRQAWEIQILGRSIQKVKRLIRTCDPKFLAKYKKWEAEWTEKVGKRCLSLLTLCFLHVFITTSFINGLSAMAKKIPGFENGGIFWFTDLSTPDSFYILPLLTGLTFWLTSEIPPISRTNLLSRMKTLALISIIFVVLQASYKYEPAVYFYLIPFRIYIFTLFLMLRSKQIVKLRRSLGWPDVPVTASEQRRIMTRVISLMREFIDVVKKKDQK